MGVLGSQRYQRLTQRLPPRWSAWIDLHRTSFRHPWGGPLNGQRHRRQMVVEIAHTFAIDRVLETGTFRGDTTAFFASVFGCPIETIEGYERNYHYAVANLAVFRDISVNFGDSRTFLRERSVRPGAAEETVFFYLDAHWEEDLPLAEELQIIAEHWPRAVVMIDDFQVPHDDRYRFDNYGEGKALTVDYLPAVLEEWALLFPSIPARAETGFRRGSCVLLSPALAPRATDLSTVAPSPEAP